VSLLRRALRAHDVLTMSRALLPEEKVAGRFGPVSVRSD
jgi:hypothetical protein